MQPTNSASEATEASVRAQHAPVEPRVGEILMTMDFPQLPGVAGAEHRCLRLIERWLPPARVCHPHTPVLFVARAQGRSLVR